MRRLLIIDNQKDLLLLYKIEFESEGYHVDTARNARKALNMCDKKHYDLIILEINLPGMDRKELMEKLLVRDKKIPIIINSASYRYHDFFYELGRRQLCVEKLGFNRAETEGERVSERKYIYDLKWPGPILGSIFAMAAPQVTKTEGGVKETSKVQPAWCRGISLTP